MPEIDRHLVDLTGRRFGKLTVRRECARAGSGKRQWLCDCDCGKETIVLHGNLAKGNGTRSCGCLRKPDLTGLRFGSLVVLGPSDSRKWKFNRRSTWQCSCDCGNVILALGTSLSSGDTKTCGCSQRTLQQSIHAGHRYGKLAAVRWTGRQGSKGAIWEFLCECGRTYDASLGAVLQGNTQSCGCSRRLDDYSVGMTYLWSRYRSSAALRGLAWDLDRGFFETLLSYPCHYCGSAPTARSVRLRKPRLADGDIEKRACLVVANGLDRIDSSLGYDASNVVTCCSVCNLAKSDTDHSSFVSWLSRAASNLASCNAPL